MICFLLLAGLGLGADEPVDAAGIEFFENKVRPVLAENCYRCHGAEKQEGHLRLDRVAGIRKGGDRGPAINAGKPDESRLIQAIRYTDPDLQMPPKGRLPEQQIEDLQAWVRRGAPAPKEDAVAAVQPYKTFDLAERRRHWSYQPVRDVQPPRVKDASWPTSPIDHFILARLEEAGLRPAPAADKRTLIRRLSFDLIGLPPTPEEVQAFVSDDSPQAYENLVKGLLNSPHYGERWGRHWLDLVRYAETLGHEFDYELFHAWRYRDYVIRAFNADVPYNQFVLEHLAGDLLPAPRRNADHGFHENESILGTSFFWLGEAKHSPVDIRQEQANRIDNQIDVLGKAFLAQTIACARCHDHKFDAIATEDYYALAGYLKSTRYQQAAIDPPQRIQHKVQELRRLKDEIDSQIATEPLPGIPSSSNEQAAGVLFEDFSRPDWQGWHAAGEAFGTNPTQRGECILSDDPNRSVKQWVPAGWAHSALLSRRLEGALRSEMFEIKYRNIHYLAAGRGSRINLVIDGFMLIRSPIYGGLTIELKDDRPGWRTMDASMWLGHRAYIELIDSVVPNLSQPASSEMESGQPGQGYLAIDEIRFSNDGPPPKPPDSLSAEPNFSSTASKDLLTEYRRIEQSIPLPTYAPAACDGTGEDERVFHRGNYRTPGEIAPRRLPAVLWHEEQPAPKQGSGRLELAHRLIDPANPLLARVMVNRIWQHHFGQGIVRSPDDFGRMGQTPTHPELLDYLAAEFIRNGWSIKHMHRLMLLSSTYRLASSAERGVRSAEYESIATPHSALRTPHSVDPDNRLLSHMPVRRLEAEAIHDAVLAVSGRLDRRLYGPSVLPHLTPFMEGRGRPATSGPLDGDGRRSIYLNVRRNFLNPMFLAFDYPIPFTTIGRRSASNVPAQALSLMNGPFVAQEASRWADRLLKQPDRTPGQRVELMYETAFARRPDIEETIAALAFLDEQLGRYGGDRNDPRAWADLCHVLLNVKEFIFVE